MKIANGKKPSQEMTESPDDWNPKRGPLTDAEIAQWLALSTSDGGEAEPPVECPHSLVEREAATALDGLCSICLGAENVALHAEVSALGVEIADMSDFYTAKITELRAKVAAREDAAEAANEAVRLLAENHVAEVAELRNLIGLQAVRTASMTDRGDVACANVLVPIPDHIWKYGIYEFDPNHPEYGIDTEGRRCLSLDACIVPAVLALWNSGIVTRSCCCGHGSGWGLVTIYIDCAEIAKRKAAEAKEGE